MNSPLDLEQRYIWHRDELLREAASERLARLAQGRAIGVRTRAAVALYKLAAWLDAEEAHLHLSQSM